MPAILGLGTAAFLPDYGLGQAGAAGRDLLRAALDRGITYVDTAAAYGDGEQALGELAARLATSRVRVATKIEAGSGGVRQDALVAAARASLGRLRSPRVDTVLLHSASPASLESQEAAAAFAELTEAGLIAHAGASTYGVGAAIAALDRPWVDAVQVEFSLLNQEVVRAVGARKRAGQELIVRSVLCKGLLTARRAAARDITRPVADAIERLERLAGDAGWTLPELAIRFALDTPGVDVVLVGAGSVGELDVALAAAARPPLTAAQLDALAAFDRSRENCVHPERWRAVSAS